LDGPDFDGLFDDVGNGASHRQRLRGDLLDKYASKDWRGVFTAARMAGLSIAFCGPTGSGKSDLARRCLGVNRPGSRMVTIETDDEFGDVGPQNKAPLFYDDTQITSDEAVRIALRLVPVEIALQEVRGPEAYSLLRAMNSGHGGVTTWHSVEGVELEALVMMARQHPAGREMTEDKLMAMARDAFDVIAYCYRDGNKFGVSSVRLMALEAA
jgi:type IV secretion system protein VirB11